MSNAKPNPIKLTDFRYYWIATTKDLHGRRWSLRIDRSSGQAAPTTAELERTWHEERHRWKTFPH
jgi:hypothetical protein